METPCKLLLSLLSLSFVCLAFRCETPCEPTYVAARQVQWSATALDNSGLTPIPTSGGQVPRAAFGIRLICPAEFNPTDTTGANTDCGLAFVVDTMVSSIRIFTRFDLDAHHMAGTDVTALFKAVLEDGALPFSTTVPNPALTTHIRYAEVQSAVGLLNRPEPTVQADLLLTSPPPTSVAAQFTIEIVRTNGSVVGFDTPEITLF